MANFFSLQPQQTEESNLSKFASATPNLEHIGSSQTYLDPSGGHGETLHSPFEDPNAPNITGTRGGSGGLMQANGDVGPDLSPQTGTSTTGTRTVGAPQQQQQSGMNMSPDQISALQTLGQVQTGLSAVPNSAVNALKTSLKSSPDGSKMSDSEIDSFIQSLSNPDLYKTGGLLEGQQNLYESLNPSATEGYSLGADTNLDTSWLNSYTTGTRPGSDQSGAQSLLDKFKLGDVQSALGVGQAAVTGDPAAILSSLNRAAPTVAKYITDNKDVLKDVGSLASVAGGAYSLYQGIQGNNPSQIASGLGQLLTGAGTSRVGLEVLSQLTGASSQAISTAFSAVGGLTGAYGLYQAINNGDPVQALLSAASIYGSLSTVAPSVFTPLTTMAASALQAVAPELAASLGIGAGVVVGSEAGAIATEAAALGISGAGAGVTGASSALSGVSTALSAAAAPLAVAAIVVMAVVSWVGAHEESQARQSGWWNNPIMGQLYSGALEGQVGAGKIADAIAATGIENVPTDDLMKVIPTLSSDVVATYKTAQGGAGAVRASDTISGNAPSGAYQDPDYGGVDQYQARTQRANATLESVVSELLKRGVSYEQLGQIDVGFNPAYQSLDMSDPWSQYYAPNASAWDAYAGGRAGGLSSYLMGQAGTNGGGSADSYTARAILEKSMLENSRASEKENSLNPYTAAYGGPVYALMARLGIDPNGVIQQHFDPYASVRGSLTDYNIPDEHIRPWLMDIAERQGAFTSGGG